MNSNQKLVIAGTAIAVAAPAALVLGRKIVKRIQIARTSKTAAVETN